MNKLQSVCRGADAVVTALRQIGAETLFVMSGNQLMPVFDACVGTQLRLVHVRHEAAAVHMADAWGRITGAPGIALLPAGPGFVNGLSALYSARMSESPVIVLSGHAPLARRGQGGFQELPQAEMASGLCKASWTVERAEDFGPAVLQAAAIAVSGRPGPVHVALPFDLLEVAIPAGAPTGAVPSGGEADLAPVAQAIAAAERPLILAGPLLLQPHAKGLAAALEAATGAPVVAMESPRGINDPALGAFAEVLAEADLVVLLGKRADFTLRFGEALAEDARVICLDPEPDELARAKANLGARLDLAIETETRAALEQLTAEGAEQRNANEAWRERVREAVAFRPPEWFQLPDGPGGAPHPANSCGPIQEILDADADAVLVVDGGEFGQWAQACLNAPNRLINGPSGAIGGGLPFAVAAKLAKPESTVLALMGDGTAGFHFTEFDTAARYGAALIAVIGNDARWNAEYQIQLQDYGPDRLLGCELGEARYDRAAEGLGCHGEFAETADALPGCLERAVTSGRPVCVNLLIDGQPAPVIRTD